MWKTVAKALNFNIPQRELDRIAPILDKLHDDFRRAVDRDLSTVEPIAVFRPDGR